MNIALPEHRSLEEVIALVISMARSGADRDDIEVSLVEEIGLSPYDAALAWDRVHGGIVRASTQRLDNRPDRADDPLAWLSFEYARRDPSIIAAIYPKYAEAAGSKSRASGQTATARPWWKFW